MYKLFINGKTYTAEEDKKLLPFLRDDLHLTAAKDGCSEGVCGTCTVLVDGQKMKACVLSLSKLEGKQILTVEGIPAEEMRVYEHCFAEAGAVQCGFCIPGMIISAKSLLDKNLNPTRSDVKQAIKSNLCRCTGYKKIEDAILMAAEFFREKKQVPPAPKTLHMDEHAKRIDAAEKVNGSGIFADDIAVDGMLYARCIYSRYPRACINRIDISRAEAHPDCVRVLTKADVPCNKIGHIKQDWDVMMGEGDITRYVGNVLAVIATDKKEKLDEIAAMVEVDYTELPAVTNPFDALRGDAPLIHPDGNVMSRANLVRGNADEAIKNSKYVVTRKYKTGWQEHGFMEPECCVAMPEGADGLLIYTTSQSVYDVQRECAQMLQLPKEKVHCRAPLVGGGFGGTRANPNAPRKGDNIRVQLNVSFEEAAFGCKKEVTVGRVEQCPDCKGNGCAPGTTPEVCPDCKGTGSVRTTQRTPFGMAQSTAPCSKCRGTGKIIHQPCPTCRGMGNIRKQHKISVSVPAGIDDGQTISLRGQGNSGANGGPQGDMLVTIIVRPHARFERDGSSVLLEQEISYAQAALGAELEVPTLDGKVRYTISEGTQTGTTFRLKGKGIPYVNSKSRGDQFVTVVVETPTHLNKEQKELLRSLEQQTDDATQPKRKRFFDKFK